MQRYTIKEYHKGFERDQARIGKEVARKWAWPYAYGQESLLRIHAQPGFDPETRQYCFYGDEMVGYMFSDIVLGEGGSASTANIEFPRMLPEHEDAALMLMRSAIETLERKGVSRVTGRVTTMVPGNVQLAERTGFFIHDWTYKMYYSYEMGWGRINFLENLAEEINPVEDLEACSRNASRWYKRPPEWCRSHLEEWHKAGEVLTHAGVRLAGKLVASCMASPNEIRTTTAANYYIYTPDEHSLKSLLSWVVDWCIEQDIHNLIADLIYEHRLFEPVYQELGFQKVADWARCEMDL